MPQLPSYTTQPSITQPRGARPYVGLLAGSLLALHSCAATSNSAATDVGVRGTPTASATADAADAADPTPAAAPPSRLAAGTTERTATGINIEVDEIDPADIERIAGLGIQYARVGLRWARVERGARGMYNWSRYDRLDNMLKRAGLIPIYVMAHTNDLYNTDDLWFNEAPEREGFAVFASTAVARYNRPGVIWELGNEQNTHRFWRVPIKGNTPKSARQRAQSYMGMAKVAVPAIHKRVPKATVITGGVTELNWKVTQAFHDEALKLGALTVFDGLAVHTYGKPMQTPEAQLRGIQLLREQIARYGGPRDYPIYQTECGLSLHNDDTSGERAERLQQQAEANVRTYLLGQLSGFPLSAWYEWRRKQRNWVDRERGMVEPSGEPRPMYQAASTLIKALQGYRFQRRVELRQPDDYALLFTRGDQRKLVVWTSAAEHEVEVPLQGAAGPVQATDLMGKQRQLRMKGGPLRVKLTHAPLYLRAAPATPPKATATGSQSKT